MCPAATIVIATRNRSEDLRRALASAFSQDVPVEVLVMDDASEDDTAEMVQAEFPKVRLLRTEQSRGYIVQRNRGVREAVGEVIFSIDDDAEFGSTDTVRRTLEDFSGPRIGAVAIPHVDTLTGRIVNAPAPDDGQTWCLASYVGTAHALRRDVFLQLGGYREDLVHQGEEGDYCLRMLAAGFVTRLGGAPPILHHESPRRSFARMDFYGRRNDILFAWRHVPAWNLMPHLLATTGNGVKLAFQTGRLRSMLRGILAGHGACLTGRGGRAPVSPAVYRLHRALKKRGPLAMESIEKWLSPPEDASASVGKIPPGTELAPPLKVGVMITSRNRCAMLRDTLQKVLACNPPPDEVLVCADGCADGTAAMLAAEFPEVKVAEHQVPLGSIPSRDQLLRMATTSLVVSLDDDSHPVEPDFFAKVRELAAHFPQAGVFTFPQQTDEFPESLTQIRPAEDGRAQVGSFTDSGAAFRRDLYLELGGFPLFFEHAYEEPDYALQCLAAGHAVVHEPALTIRHHYSRAGRNEQRTHQFHARNEVGSAMMRCPFVLLPGVLLFRVVRQFSYAYGRGWSWVLREPLWWLAALRHTPIWLRKRHALSVGIYWKWMNLARHPLPLEPAASRPQ